MLYEVQSPYRSCHIPAPSSSRVPRAYSSFQGLQTLVCNARWIFNNGGAIARFMGLTGDGNHQRRDCRLRVRCEQRTPATNVMSMNAGKGAEENVQAFG